MPVFIIVAISAIGVIADLFMKWAGKGPGIDWKWAILGVILYTLTLPGVFFAIKYVKLSAFGAIYSVCTILLLVLVGVLNCNEKLTIYEIGGVAAAVVSVILLSRFA